MNKIEKNLIFVTGSSNGQYKKLATELSWHIYKAVTVFQPCSNIRAFQTAREVAIQNSLFFSQALFYGSLPSRENVIIAIPELTMKTILQFIILFEKVRKNVFVIVDDRSMLTMYSKDRYRCLLGRLPAGCGMFFKDYISTEDGANLSASVERLVDKLSYTSVRLTKETVECFNDILDSMPEFFKEELKKTMLGGSEFAPVPFNLLVKNLLPNFNDAEEKEEGEEQKLRVEDLKLPPVKRTIQDYFNAMNKDNPPTTPPFTPPPQQQQPQQPPPSLNIQESEGEFISLFEDLTLPPPSN